MKKCKNGIGPNNIVTFNEESEFLLRSNIELVNNDKFLHKNDIVIFITKYLKKKKYNYVIENDDGNRF